MQFFSILSLLASTSLALAVPAPIPTPAAQLEKRQGGGVGISAASASRVQRSFTASGVVPTLIPSIVPQVEVNVNYGAKKVDLGTRLTTLDTVAPPTFSITRRSKDPATTKYSLFLVDPDVPGPQGPPVVKQPRINFLHWYISGITAATAGDDSGNLVTFYEPPTPASPGEQHRYTFLVYKEPTGYTPDVLGAQVRPAFDLLGYTTRGKLELVGGNLFNQSLTNGITTREWMK